MTTVLVNGIEYAPRLHMPRFCGEKSGDYLRRLRVKRRWSMRYVAEACECHVSTLSDAERGQHLPGIATLVALAGLYGITLDEIVRAEEPR